jgi:hypothetical protein
VAKVSVRIPRWAAALLGAGALYALSIAAMAARREFVRAVVGRDGPVSSDLSLPPSSGAGLARAGRVRVVLLDGLVASAAAGLPALSEVCAAGQELVIDVGFPTVSLPVQAVLWSGRTQQQTGLFYRAKQLDAPLAGSLAGQVEGSVAVAESHAFIVRSFGFSRVRPEPGRDPEDVALWEPLFEAAAVEEVASPARLVHVHVLRIDDAGHASGAASQAYADAVTSADALLARLRAAGPKDALWLVLADHGHTAAGGHGDAQSELRMVRGCLAGPGIAPSREPAPVHLVDVARALADALGVPLAEDARGRRWPIDDAAPGATLPRPGAGRWIAAVVVVALALALAGRSGRSQGSWSLRTLPWAAAVGIAGVAAYPGWPSLADQAVFAPRGLHLWYGCLPAAAVALALGLGRAGPWRSAVAQLVPVVGLLAGALILCGGAEVWLLPALGLGEPGAPVMPRWTAASSVLFVLLRAVAEGAALAWLLAPAAERVSAFLAGRRDRA